MLIPQSLNRDRQDKKEAITLLQIGRLGSRCEVGSVV